LTEQKKKPSLNNATTHVFKEDNINNNKFITKLLKLKGLKVKNWYFGNYNKELHLIVAPYKNGCRCPICGRRCKIHKHAKDTRTWRDIVVCGIEIYFHYHPKEIICPTHGQSQEQIPWADEYSRITYRLEYLIVKYAQGLTQKQVSEFLRIPKSTLSNQLHNIISRCRKSYKIRGLVSIGVDEIAYKRRMKYATIVYDLDKNRVIWIGKGKAKASLQRFFDEQLSDYQKRKIKWGCCDISKGYINALKENCPGIQIVLDKFHIVKALNEALDSVRKDEWRQTAVRHRKALKGMRWLLFKHSGNRSKKETRIIASLRKSNRRIHRAWILKDEFELLWDYKAKWAAERFLKKWITKALKSRIDSIKKFARTMRRYFDLIVSYTDKRITNAAAEGMNRIIKQIKNRSSGFKELTHFADLIYLTVGDVDIPVQIPARFRTA